MLPKVWFREKADFVTTELLPGQSLLVGEPCDVTSTACSTSLSVVEIRGVLPLDFQGRVVLEVAAATLLATAATPWPCMAVEARI